MPVFVQRLALAVSLAASAAGMARADGGFYLPAPPSGPGGEDSIETAGGTRCRQAINGNGAYLDVGVAATRSTRNDEPLNPYRVGGNGGTEALGYARMIVPIGPKPTRIDCSRIYQLEIARMQREIELLKMAAE
jgi:hypothetical protein